MSKLRFILLFTLLLGTSHGALAQTLQAEPEPSEKVIDSCIESLHPDNVCLDKFLFDNGEFSYSCDRIPNLNRKMYRESFILEKCRLLNKVSDFGGTYCEGIRSERPKYYFPQTESCYDNAAYIKQDLQLCKSDECFERLLRFYNQANGLDKTILYCGTFSDKKTKEACFSGLINQNQTLCQSTNLDDPDLNTACQKTERYRAICEGDKDDTSDREVADCMFSYAKTLSRSDICESFPPNIALFSYGLDNPFTFNLSPETACKMNMYVEYDDDTYRNIYLLVAGIITFLVALLILMSSSLRSRKIFLVSLLVCLLFLYIYPVIESVNETFLIGPIIAIVGYLISAPATPLLPLSNTISTDSFRYNVLLVYLVYPFIIVAVGLLLERQKSKSRKSFIFTSILIATLALISAGLGLFIAAAIGSF
jgi:hypothetical protein